MKLKEFTKNKDYIKGKQVTDIMKKKGTGISVRIELS
jgi:hypothetical protein